LLILVKELIVSKDGGQSLFIATKWVKTTTVSLHVDSEEGQEVERGNFFKAL
jgi:hypothetical protein